MTRPLKTADLSRQIGLLNFSFIAVFFDQFEKFFGNRFIRDIVKELMKSATQPDTERRNIVFHFRFSG